MQANRLQNALKQLGAAIREAEAALAEMRAERDPLAVHIYISRRQYRNMPDSKSGKRSEAAAKISWHTARDLGFRGSLGEWERLMGAQRPSGNNQFSKLRYCVQFGIPAARLAV